MDANAYIEKLKQLAEQEDLLGVNHEVNELRSKFDDYVIEEERKLQVAQLEAEEKGESAPEANGDFGKEEFYEIYQTYKSKRKELVDQNKAVELTNLKQKKDLILRLQHVISSEENIGAAFASFKEIQEQWSSIGAVPRKERNDVQAEYSRLVEDFFYNIKIYKELQDHDLHRNKQLKSDVIDGLKGLNKVESIKEVETSLRQLQNDWENIGPVPNEEWEELKGAYWTEVRSIYERINRFYEDRRSQQKQNIDSKKKLIEETNAIVERCSEFDTIKLWEKETKQILGIQEKWKSIGFGPKKENNAVWKEFRGLCDTFFAAKKEFYKLKEKDFDAVAAEKGTLIEKAKSLQTSTDWNETSSELIKLQKKWKKLGHAGRKNEQKLWKEFRAACDAFFNARKKHFEEEEKQYLINLKEKEKLISELEKLKLPASKNDAIEKLKAIGTKFNSIGHVPRKDKDRIFKSYKKVRDEKYASLKLDAEEKNKVIFEAKLDALSSDTASENQIYKLKQDIRKEIDHWQKEILQLENNLGFFANSKGANPLKDQVQQKIDAARVKIEEAKAKLKMIPK